jgi:uncharacterized protein YkwD
MLRKSFASSVILALATTLSACGGGGDSAPTPVVPPPNPDMVAASSPCAISNLNADLLAAINARRAQGGSCEAGHSAPPSAPLMWNADLESAAQGHSQVMSTYQFFAHEDPWKNSVGNRVSKTAYKYQQVGENIAAGYMDVPSVMAAWMKSPPHCKVILIPTLKDFGGACVQNTHANSQYKNYWTTVFGLPAN